MKENSVYVSMEDGVFDWCKDKHDIFGINSCGEVMVGPLVVQPVLDYEQVEDEWLDILHAKGIRIKLLNVLADVTQGGYELGKEFGDVHFFACYFVLQEIHLVKEKNECNTAENSEVEEGNKYFFWNLRFVNKSQ